MQIEITDKEIQNAETLLLPQDCHFDEERRIFIKDTTTLDLQAVPGSGKTTALLAKLFILSKKMPFKNNSGILVISHTNAAVDEIKDKLGKIVPELFEYPNYVGTIQGFVDNFLAIPFYTSVFKYPPQRIDDEIIYERCSSLLESSNPLVEGIKRKKNANATRFLFSLQLDQNRNFTQVTEGFGSSTKTYKLLGRFKKMIFRDGFLKFSEAYDLAFEYLRTVPKIVNLLQQRFSFIFVDEMQDMDAQQTAILENCFSTQSDNVCFQRIGDLNQAIFSNSCDSIWISRSKLLHLNGSQRLTPQIARIIQHFSLDSQSIEGRMVNPDSSKIEIKPYVLVYEESSITNVIPYYIKLINKLKKQNKIKNIQNEKYSIIGWRKSNTNNLKQYNINSYWPSFVQEDVKSKNDYSFLYEYLIKFDKTNCSLESIRKSILNALIKILRLEKVKDSGEKYYSKRTLFDYLKSTNLREYEQFKLNLLIWCKDCIQNRYQETYSKIISYLPTLLSLFNSNINKSTIFVNTIPDWNSIKISENPNNNTIYNNDLKIDIQTIHSIKGKTVTGVLYLDTFNAFNCPHSSPRFESDKLYRYFLGEYLYKNKNEDEYIKQAAKMIYVGFSRPTHLLCFAVQKNRYDQYLSNINQEDWNIIYI